MAKARESANRLYTFIVAYMGEHTYSPTYAEMSGELDVSKSQIHGYINILEAAQLLTVRRQGGKSSRTRTIVLNQRAVNFTPDEWMTLETAWGTDIKSEIVKAAGQTRFVVTSP